MPFLETMCELQSQDRGFNDLASMRLPESACLAGAQTRIRELGVHIVERAQEQGSLRPDLTPEDLAFVIWSHSRVTEATHAIAPGAWRRHLTFCSTASEPTAPTRYRRRRSPRSSCTAP